MNETIPQTPDFGQLVCHPEHKKALSDDVDVNVVRGMFWSFIGI